LLSFEASAEKQKEQEVKFEKKKETLLINRKTSHKGGKSLPR
tara:strand:+ start:1700 stop:1825 length:126 start_codon:yes stop_codon:yes gene_type:complete